jgi:hypothetical protein
LVAFLFKDLEMALLVTDYRTPWLPFGVPSFSLFRVVNSFWAIGMSIVWLLAHPTPMLCMFLFNSDNNTEK